jgi:hypothetical protein
MSRIVLKPDAEKSESDRTTETKPPVVGANPRVNDALERIKQLGAGLGNGSDAQRLSKAQEIVNLGIGERIDSPLRKAAGDALLLGLAGGQSTDAERKFRYMLGALGFKVSKSRVENPEEHASTTTYSIIGPIEPRKAVPKKESGRPHEEAETAHITPKRELPGMIPSPITSPLEQQPRSYARLLLDAAVKTQVWWLKNVTAPSVGLLLLPLSVAGCGPAPEMAEISPQQKSGTPSASPTASTETPKKDYKPDYWWPGFVLRNGKMTDVSLGFPKEFFPPDLTQYDSPDKIPQDMRKDAEKTTADAIGFSKFALKDSAYGAIAPVTVFFPFVGSGGGSTNYGVGGFELVDANGKVVAACFEGCPEYQDEIFYSMGSGSMGYDTGRVVLHEMLHHAYWLISDEERTRFGDFAHTFLNATGSSWRDDEVVQAIYYGAYDTGPDTSAWLKGVDPKDISNGAFKPIAYSDAELDAWATQKFGSSSTTEATNAKAAIKSYMDIHSSVMGAQGYKESDADRDGYVIIEGFPRFGANYGPMGTLYDGKPSSTQSRMPAFMGPLYKSVMKDDIVDQTVAHGGGYFDAKDKFNNEFTPLLSDFISWMKQQHPELNTLGVARAADMGTHELHAQVHPAFGSGKH